MKTRLAVVLTLSLLGALLVGVLNSPAEAAPFSARISKNPPIVGESIRVYGAVPPASRPVKLQALRGGRWVGVGSSRTAAGGAYAFAVRATSAVQVFRVFAPKAKVKKKKRPARYSNLVRVLGKRPTLSLDVLPAPVGIATSGNTAPTELLTPAMAAFRPARPGAIVRVQRLVGGTWTTVPGGTARQNSGGNAYFKGLAAGSSIDQRTFRAVSTPSAGVATVVSPSKSPSYWANGLDENFTDAGASANRWISRPSSPDSNRRCAWPDPDRFMVNPSSGVATLEVAKQSTNPTGNSCPHGFWENAVVGTADSVNPETQRYGYFAARIKMHSALGAHGGFWLQGLGDQSAEIDIEYFGDGRRDGGLFNFVHVVNGTDIETSGGARPGHRSILGAGKDPSDGWHVYSIQWTPSGYVFRLDGVPTFATNQPRVSSVEQEFMLSLATSDYELPYMSRAGRSSAQMQVDWVRSWTMP